MPKLGVNIDHIATVREARGEYEPDPIEAAKICKAAGANSIVCHLREDRRHINDQDVRNLRKTIKTNLTLELSLNKKIIDIAYAIKPTQAMFVPERRQEVTTEGGLNVIKYTNRIKKAITLLKKKSIIISLFVDPVANQIKRAKDIGADTIEIHTGPYANAKTKTAKTRELDKIKKTAHYAHKIGLIVNAGHGLKYHDTKAVARIKEIHELNIGHSIISRSIFVGLKQAVREMKSIVTVK